MSAPGRLPRRVAKAVADPDNRVFASPASTWEMSIKAALGTIDVDVEELAGAIRDTGFEELPVRIRDTIRVRGLPPHHRDPFDRILIAQALEAQLMVVTRDPAFKPYDIVLMWG